MFPFVSDKVTEEADLNVRNNRGGARLAVTFACCVPVRSASNAADAARLASSKMFFFLTRQFASEHKKYTIVEFLDFCFHHLDRVRSG